MPMAVVAGMNKPNDHAGQHVEYNRATLFIIKTMSIKHVFI